MNILDEIPAMRRMPEDAESRAWARIKDGIQAGEEKTAHRRPPAKWRFTAVAAAAAAAAIAAAFLIIQPWAGTGGPPLSAPGPSSSITSSQSPSNPGSSPPGIPGEPIMLIGSTTPVAAASLWPDVVFPVVPSTGRSIAQAGSVIVEAGLQGSTLIVANSSDSGATWTTNQVALATAVPYVDVSLSGDGKHWIVGPPHEGGATVSTYTGAYVSTSGGALQRVSLPGQASHAAWAGSTLLVSGGAMDTHLWSSTDNGQSFTDISPSVQGSMPTPGYQGAPSISLLQLGSGMAAISLAPNGAASTATAYVTSDGATFGKGASADLPNIAPGPLNGLASTYGSDAVIVTSAAQLLKVTADAQFQPLAMSAIPSGVNSLGIQFRDAVRGIASATRTTCADGKTGCTTITTRYTTADGGAHWTPAP
ncbi:MULTISPECIES: hypothetical protein [Arthrobacter]|uniref:Exo-alpha-sialidase n=1 Tax=Arthrobacter terricola TaxID=2547396 RepID=A0A4R5K5L0_9MICC|nr:MULTISPECIES: hypothetical protein [Arthrobacter]MBT8159639.1 hypothetical protein [Arthrobacter sp. GN70]TDF87516.1 hypothetical protein E1809_24835 [Arthrobacter terricola]